jgi:putative hydrolase
VRRSRPCRFTIDDVELPDESSGRFLERLLDDVLAMLEHALPAHGGALEFTKALAHGVATRGRSEANVDPEERFKLESLLSIATLHLDAVEELPEVHRLEVAAVGPGSWAWHTVADWRYVVDALVRRSQDTASEAEPAGPARDADQRALAARWVRTVGPLFQAMQFGAAVGHLAREALGAYEVPLPRADSTRLLVAPALLHRFSSEWEVPFDDIALFVVLRDVAYASLLAQPPLAATLRGLVEDSLTSAALDVATLVARLSESSLEGPEAIEAAFANPELLAPLEMSAERQRVVARLNAALAVICGVADHAVLEAVDRLLGGRRAATEAWRRRELATDAPSKAAESFLGLEIDRRTAEQGRRFVEGVIERDGRRALRQLWSRADGLPTPAELEAPGLWLERLAIQDLEGA